MGEKDKKGASTGDCAQSSAMHGDVIAHGRSLALHKPLYGDKVSQYDSFDREHLRFVGTEPSFHFVESGNISLAQILAVVAETLVMLFV